MYVCIVYTLQLVTHLSIPDELFTCCTAKARLHYVGMNTNGNSLLCTLSISYINVVTELTFKAGDMVNVIGFKDLEEKWHPVS